VLVTPDVINEQIKNKLNKLTVIFVDDSRPGHEERLRGHGALLVLGKQEVGQGLHPRACSTTGAGVPWPGHRPTKAPATERWWPGHVTAARARPPESPVPRRGHRRHCPPQIRHSPDRRTCAPAGCRSPSPAAVGHTRRQRGAE
jgi:hypothetical protein